MALHFGRPRRQNIFVNNLAQDFPISLNGEQTVLEPKSFYGANDATFPVGLVSTTENVFVGGDYGNFPIKVLFSNSGIFIGNANYSTFPILLSFKAPDTLFVGSSTASVFPVNLTS